MRIENLNGVKSDLVIGDENKNKGDIVYDR